MKQKKNLKIKQIRNRKKNETKKQMIFSNEEMKLIKDRRFFTRLKYCVSGPILMQRFQA